MEKNAKGFEFRKFATPRIIGGIAISTWPYSVPFKITFRQAAAAPESQSLLLLGTAILLPCVLAYTGYCFWVFRGKASHEHDAVY